MWGTRNRIAHGYLLDSPEIVQATVATEVPLIVQRIQAHLAD